MYYRQRKKWVHCVLGRQHRDWIDTVSIDSKGRGQWQKVLNVRLPYLGTMGQTAQTSLNKDSQTTLSPHSTFIGIFFLTYIICKFKVYNVIWLDLLWNGCHNKVSNTSNSSHNCHFLAVITFMIYSPNNFQVYNTVLLTTVTMLCMNFLILKLTS